ncbi:MAG: ribosomal protein [Alphaproteobacteria bacterium]|jgi:small subunit ribosomal protein S5|nr:ribosomal protein [Alphaproteobacteria bacterium]
MAKIEKAPQGAGAPGKGREGGREGGRGDGREGGGRDRKGGGRDRDKKEGGDREGSELVERLVAINRVAKVVKGGRRFGFAALVVVGDGRGRIGAGAGKAREVPEAIKKATDQAKRRMIRVPLRDGRTIHHDIEARFGAGLVRLRTAEAGTGIIAGGPLRAVFEVLGIQDVVAKSIGSSNPYNMVKAALEAFKLMESPRMVASRRGRRVNEVLGRKGDAKEKSDE